jgi:aerobic carbon-monoxide dehydrogenase large subunit
MRRQRAASCVASASSRTSKPAVWPPLASRASLARAVACSKAPIIRVNPSGDITVFTGSHNHGQGHETVFAQIVGDMLGVSSSLVEIVHGDTARSPFGLGTYGSRSAAVGGSAIAKAVSKIIDKGRKIAGYLLEASEQDIEFAAGKFTVSGTDRSMTFGEIAGPLIFRRTGSRSTSWNLAWKRPPSSIR